MHALLHCTAAVETAQRQCATAAPESLSCSREARAQACMDKRSKTNIAKKDVHAVYASQQQAQL
jgi:hypothetical protein